MSEMDEIKQAFLAEAVDLIERIRDSFGGYPGASDQPDRLADVLRALHTLKGGASMFDMQPLMRDSHSLEEALLPFKDKPARINAKVITKILKFVDRLENYLTQDPDPAKDPAPQATETSSAEPAQEPAAHPASRGSHEMIRIGLDRVQKNLDVVSELFLTRNQLRYLVEQRTNGHLSEDDFLQKWESLDNTLRKNISELEHIAMSMRMMPVKGLFRRMEKTVRSYEEQTGKTIQVVTSGEETELDKKIMDSLAEPLIHLVRNAIDHGIEDADTRLAVGKPAQGRVELTARVAGNNVEVCVRDDGKGIDHETILAAAKRKGVDVSRVRTPDDAVRLIFAAGFSTRDEANDISGRGIGMDSVKSYVDSVGGQIAVRTEVGQGSTFVLTLPLGMSVTSALIAVVNGHKFAVATSDVLETACVAKNAIFENGGLEYYKRGEEFIPCLRVRDYLFTKNVDRVGVANSRVPLCVVQHGRGVFALLMDELIENVEIVSNPMPPRAANLRYVDGVSILATGEVAFVVSLSRLCDEIFSRSGGVHAAA